MTRGKREARVSSSAQVTQGSLSIWVHIRETEAWSDKAVWTHLAAVVTGPAAPWMAPSPGSAPLGRLPLPRP